MKAKRRKQYLKAHTECDYCMAGGIRTDAIITVPRRIGEQHYTVNLCERHYIMILEIESEGGL